MATKKRQAAKVRKHRAPRGPYPVAEPRGPRKGETATAKPLPLQILERGVLAPLPPAKKQFTTANEREVEK